MGDLKIRIDKDGETEEMYLGIMIEIQGPAELHVKGITTFGENGMQTHTSGRIEIGEGKKIVIT
jgi:hypothetical protein